MNGRTEAEDMEREYQRAALRDTFAAAALTGLLGSGDLVIDPRNGTATTLTVLDAYRWADAMLRERSRAGQKMAESDSSRAVCPERDNANHDAAPAARAPADSCVPRRAVDCDSDGTDKADPLTRDCGTGDISEAQIDALECVVEDGRIVGMSVYGHLRSLLVRLRPEWESDRPKPISDERLAALEELSALDQELELKHGIQGNPMIKPQVNNHPEPYAKSDEKRVFYDTKSPRNGALSGCETVPDADSRVWETPCTPQPQATPPQGSVQGEDSFRDSRNAKEPVAWAVMRDDWYHGVYLTESAANTFARRLNDSSSTPVFSVVPLYRHPQPTLTDEEREAVEWAESHFLSDYEQLREPRDKERADTLRGLLERLK